MNKFVFFSFIFMGWAFFELSGGTDFVPRKAEIMAAAKAEAEADRLAELAATDAARKLAENADLARSDSVETPETAELQITLAAPVQTYFQSEDRPAIVEPVHPAELQVSAEDVFPTTLASASPTLISLEQSGDLFAQPITQLGGATDQTAPEPTVTATPLDLREVAGSRVNMRSGPGTGYGVLASLPRGTTVEVIGDDGRGWVQLRLVEDQSIGWMAERLLTAPTG